MFLRKTSVYTLQSRKPEPSVYIRSLVQGLLVYDSQILGSISAEKFCRDDIADLVLPSSQLLDTHNVVEMPSDPRFQIAKHTTAFIKRMSQVILTQPFSYMHANRSSLLSILIERFASIVVECAVPYAIQLLTGTVCKWR